MFGFRKSAAATNDVPKPNPPPTSNNSSGNYFDSDSDSDDNKKKTGLKPARRTSSEPALLTQEDVRGKPSSSASTKASPARDRNQRFKDGFSEEGGVQKQSTEELENYAVYKSEETTKGVNNCLKIAENIREDATKTLDMLHQQGDQIERTHNMAVEVDKDLSKGEKLLNNLGGMFSMPWKPKKTKHISGPVVTSEKPSKKSEKHAEEKKKLTQTTAPPKATSQEPTTAMQKVELEKQKQDDGLSDLSNILGDLKGMAVDMGGELDRQNKALDHLHEDVDELNSRVKGANQRARHLLSK